MLSTLLQQLCHIFSYFCLFYLKIFLIKNMSSAKNVLQSKNLESDLEYFRGLLKFEAAEQHNENSHKKINMNYSKLLEISNQLDSVIDKYAEVRSELLKVMEFAEKKGPVEQSLCEKVCQAIEEIKDDTKNLIKKLRGQSTVQMDYYHNISKRFTHFGKDENNTYFKEYKEICNRIYNYDQQKLFVTESRLLIRTVMDDFCYIIGLVECNNDMVKKLFKLNEDAAHNFYG